MFSDVHRQVQLGLTVHVVFILLSKLAFARNTQEFKLRAVQLSTTAPWFWLAIEIAPYHIILRLLCNQLKIIAIKSDSEWNSFSRIFKGGGGRLFGVDVY